MIDRKDIKKAKRIVVKIGSSIITDEKDVIDEHFLDSLAKQVSLLTKKGKEIIIVSSGAVAAGMMVLKLKEKPKKISEKQAVAACGQGYLIHKYSEIFSRYNLLVAQVLLTSEDIAVRTRYLNAKNTLENLISKRIIPVINENDTVATKEIKMGDNDNLSAEVACLIDADLLVILSDVEGFYDKDPNLYSDAKVIQSVSSVDKYFKKASNKAGSSVGTGGIFTKLQAAKKAMIVGIPSVLAKGREESVLLKILDGKSIGTLFCPGEKKISHKKYFIAYNVKTKGKIFIDKGAMDAILKKGKSLLPSGVLQVSGNFKAGDVVDINFENKVVARGLINYNLLEMEKIKGKRSSEIEKILGYRYDDEVVHRNNMVIVEDF
ncbi:MAG: glutamate 5-kinase [bacterium]